MPLYKLTYFDARGYAEPARILFHLAGVPFEDNRLTHGDGSWEKIKDKTPFGQVPVLSVDGFDIPQSAAIIRYLANKFGYAGKTPEEQAWADAIVDQFKDFMGAFRQLIMAQRSGKPAEEIAKISSEVAIPARDSYFKILNGLLEKSKSGFLVGDGLTFADIVVVENLTTLEKNQFFTASEHPKLSALREKVHAVPAIKTWVATRPDTQFYKLSYFDVRAYAEPARILFHLAGVPFDDHRFPHGDGTWEKLKDKTPFGQVPVLYVDGFEIPQSAAIIRYLANKFGYAGKTPEEQAWADAIVDQFKDFMSLFREFKLAQKAGKSDVEIAKVASEVAIPARDSYFEIITNLLEKSKSGFLVGDGLTFADIVVVESLTNN